MGTNYRVIALLEDGGVKLLRVASERANDWDDFESMVDAKDYCDALLDKGWRWRGATALAVERVDGGASQRLYVRAI